MSQIYNLGGIVLQKLNFLHVDRIKSSGGEVTIMDVAYDASSAYLKPNQTKTPRSILWRNVEKIIAKNGNEYWADNIQESGNEVSGP